MYVIYGSMIKRGFYIVGSLTILMVGMWGFTDVANDDDNLTEKVKNCLTRCRQSIVSGASRYHLFNLASAEANHIEI